MGALAASLPSGASAALARHVILVDWDGFEPTLLNRGYSLPNLASLANRGSLSPAAQSTFHSFSNPARASLTTGAYPEREGNVAYVFDPQANVVLGQTRYMAAETLAEALRRSSGKTMASVQWYMVQDRGAKCGDASYLYVQPGGQFGDRVNVAIDILRRRPVNSCGQTVTVPKIPNFVAVYGPQPDELAHNEGTSGPNMKSVLEQQDRDLGRLIQATKDVGIYKNTAFILTSDHGMSDWTKTALGVLSQSVSEAGYTSEVVYPGAAPETDADVVIAPAVQVAHLHFRGAAASDPNARSKITTALLSHTEIERVFDQSGLATLRASPKLGDLVAQVRQPWSFAKADTAAGTQKASHGATTELDVPLYMSGAGISRTKPSNPGLVDVAPTISALLGIPCPANAQGRALRESFSSSASCPVSASMASSASDRTTDVVAAQSTFDNDAVESVEGPEGDATSEGWKAVGDAETDRPKPHRQGGNPRGYISTTDKADGPTLYWKAPKKFLGDRSASLDTSLSFDLRQAGEASNNGKPKRRGRRATAAQENPPPETSRPEQTQIETTPQPPPEDPSGQTDQSAPEQQDDQCPDSKAEGEEGQDQTDPEGGPVEPAEEDPGPDQTGDKPAGEDERRCEQAPRDECPAIQQGEPDSSREDDVILCGAGTQLSYDLELDPGSRLFSYYQVFLDQEGWTNTRTGEPATRDEMQDVLADLNALLIRADFKRGPETTELDNVVLREQADE